MPTVLLGEICRPRQWPTLSRATMISAGFPVYGANGKIGFTDSYTHENPTILIGCRGTCGAVHVTEPQSYVNGNAMALGELDVSRADLTYVYHYLRWRGFADVTTGSSQPQIIRERLVTVRIPLPSLDEQRRIAAILDQAEALRTKRREAIAHLDTLTASIFLDMFGHPAASNGRWPTRRIGDLCATTSGGTPSRDAKGNYGGSVPWVKSGELRSRRIVSTEEAITEDALRTSSAKLMPAGTVLLAMYGATAGAVSRLGISAATNQAVCCITPGPTLDADYLISTLGLLSESLLSRRTGGAQPNLSQGTVRDTEIPLPPLDEQVRFSARLGAIEVMRVAGESQLAACDALFSSLQDKAFKGDL